MTLNAPVSRKGSSSKAFNASISTANHNDHNDGLGFNNKENSIINRILLLIIAVSFTITSTILISRHIQFKSNSYASIDAKNSITDYLDIVEEARRAVLRYKDLTHSNQLPNRLHTPLIEIDNLNEIEKLEAFGNSQLETNNNNINFSAVTPGMSKSLESTTRDLVLAFAQDIDSKNLYLLNRCAGKSFRNINIYYVNYCLCHVLKLKTSISKATLFLFSNTPFPSKLSELAVDFKVKLIGYNTKRLPETLHRYHPSSSRWRVFHDFFSENEGYRLIYNRVWLLDARDTYFQSDPFLGIPLSGSSLHVFYGVESTPIKQCGWNSGWIRDCFGEAMVAKIGGNKILCSGVVAGTMGSVIEYLSFMSSIISGDRDVFGLQTKFPQCERNGVDQGVHNVLLHNHFVSDVKLWDHVNGPVANLQAHMSRVDEVGMKVYNKKGELVSIVHQYDRYPNLQLKLFQKFVDWVNVSDFKSLWALESECNQFDYRMDVDIFKGRCDLRGKGGATSAASCCSHCLKYEGHKCLGFTFVSGTCFLKSCGGELKGGNVKMPGAVTAVMKF